MFNTSVTMDRPQRWDSPFDHNMTDAQVELLLQRPEFNLIDKSRFPSSISLEGILKNDCRINRYKPGDIIVRDGDYGNSAFLLLKGKVTVVTRPGLPLEILGRTRKKKKSFWQQISQIWKNSPYPEARNISRYFDKTQIMNGLNTNSSILNTKYSNLRPMNFLSYSIFKFYKDLGIRYIDVGPSTENSIPNYGLCEFKESIGCQIFPKYTLEKEIG